MTEGLTRRQFLTTSTVAVVAVTLMPTETVRHALATGEPMMAELIPGHNTEPQPYDGSDTVWSVVTTEAYAVDLLDNRGRVVERVDLGGTFYTVAGDFKIRWPHNHLSEGTR